MNTAVVLLTGNSFDNVNNDVCSSKEHTLPTAGAVSVHNPQKPSVNRSFPQEFQSLSTLYVLVTQLPPN